jgi:uncharacterized protein YndB with AHSA1/START domain
MLLKFYFQKFKPIFLLNEEEFIYCKKTKKMSERVKIHLEYEIKCSPKVLFNRLSTASGLAEWFADDVRVNGKHFTFVWNKTEYEAELTLLKENRIVRFNWMEDQLSFFEFKVYQDDLTGDVSLVINDYGFHEEEDEDIKLWNSQISDLKHVIGST